MPLEEVSNLELETRMVDGQAVLRLSGELDAGTAGLLGEATRVVHAQGITTLVLDLSALEFIDSSGLHEFVVALKRQREIGGDVVLRAPTDQTRRVLDIVGLSHIFTIADATERPAAEPRCLGATADPPGPEMVATPGPPGGGAEGLPGANRS